MYESLRDQTALITGASSGIGEEFAKELHRRGAAITLIARRKEKLEAIQRECNALRPGSCDILVLDLSTSEGIKEAEQLCTLRNYDILVNNVGRGSFGEFDSLDINAEISMITLNVIAPVRIAHAVIPGMKQKKSGVIFSLSSVAAFQPLPYMATYSATKAFNFNHSVALHSELSAFGIRVVTVCPGPTATEFGLAAGVPGEMKHLHNDTSRAVVQAAIDALEKNKAFVITGWRSKLMAFASRFVPIKISTYLVKQTLGQQLV